MNRWPFLLVLSAALSAARAEIPIDLPAETATNRPVPGINVPAPLGTGDATNAVVVPPPKPRSAPPAEEPWRRIEAPAEGTDRLTYTNGDIFAGAFLGLENGVIRWQSASMTAPIRLRTGGFEEVTFRAPPPDNPSAPAAWLVFLADGSLLPARQVTFEDGNVVADLAYAGRTRLTRQQVAVLRRCDPATGGLITFADAPLYAPEKMDHRPRMRYRDTKLPDPVLLEFAWYGEATSVVSLRPFVGKAEDLWRIPILDLGIILRLTAAVWQVGSRLLGPDATDCAGRVVWVGLAVNRARGEAVFYLDGREKQRFVVERLLDLPDFGLAVADRSPRRLAPRHVLVSRINEDLNLPVPPADREAVRLMNGDQLEGRLESVSTNELAFQCAAGRMVLPLERVAQVTFLADTSAPTRDAETRFALRDGSTLRGVWQRADAQSVALRHPVLGPVTIPRNALAEVVSLGPRRPFDGELPFDRLSLSTRQRHWISEQLRIQSFASPYMFAFRYRSGLLELPPDMSWCGDLLGIADGSVRWRHPASPDQWSVPLAAVRRLFPPARSLPETPAAERATIRLINGDVLSGAPGATGVETVNLTPWYAGPLTIPRRHVALVTPHPAPADAIDMRLTAPSTGNPAPLTADGALWFEFVGRNACQSGPIPDRARLDFEVVWPPSVEPAELTANPSAGSLLQVQVEFGDVTNKSGSSLMAEVGPRKTSLTACAAGRRLLTQSFMDVEGQADLSGGGCVNLTLLADRRKRYLRVLVDGRQAGEWRPEAVRDAHDKWRVDNLPVPDAYALRLSAGGNTGAALRHIALREWREGQPLPPVSRPVAVSPLAPGEVRVVFHNGDFLTLGEIAADERTLTGRHKLLGSVTLNMAAVRALDGERREAPCPPGSGAATKR
jgi:hypothetical protein